MESTTSFSILTLINSNDEVKLETDGMCGIKPPSHFIFFTHLSLFSLISSSLQKSSELNLSVSGSHLCHPPPPCFSSSFPPLSVLPIFTPTSSSSQSNSSEISRSTKSRKSLISQIRKERELKIKNKSNQGKSQHFPCRAS